MKPRLTAITIGVDDLERSVAFYRDGLGLPTQGIIGREYEHGAVAFFDVQPGLILALWERRNLAWDADLPQTDRSPTEVSLGHNVNSREEVDAVRATRRRPATTGCGPRSARMRFVSAGSSPASRRRSRRSTASSR